MSLAPVRGGPPLGRHHPVVCQTVVPLLEQASLMLAERRRGALATMMPDGDKALFDDEGRLVSGTLPPDLISAVGEAVAGFVDREASGVVVVGESEVFVEA